MTTPPVGFIPDSTYGAILLSLIDFFLSFVVIAFIGFVLALFPHINRFKALQATPVAVSVMPARDENAEHAAVIAAAIYATLCVRHIVISAKRGLHRAGRRNTACACTPRMRRTAPPAENKAVEQLRAAAR